MLGIKQWFDDLTEFESGCLGFWAKLNGITTSDDLIKLDFDIIAYRSYLNLDFDITYWRTKTSLEVDFILGDGEIVVEVKGSNRVDSNDLNGIRTFQEELLPRKCIVVCNELSERKVGEINIMPYRNFLTALWGKGIIA